MTISSLFATVYTLLFASTATHVGWDKDPGPPPTDALLPVYTLTFHTDLGGEEGLVSG